MLNYENIAYRIFEYHEGTLDAGQKAELMEFLHQHPELNHDFALFAQARLTDEPVPAPSFRNKLFRNGLYFNWHSFSVRLVELVVISVVIFFTFYRKESISEDKIINQLNKEVKISTADEISNKNNLTADKVVFSKTELKSKDYPKAENQIRPDYNTKDTSRLNLELVSLKHREFTDQELCGYEPVFREPQKIVVKEKPAVKKVKRKKYYPKQKLNLRPTSNIVPQTTEF